MICAPRLIRNPLLDLDEDEEKLKGRRPRASLNYNKLYERVSEIVIQTIAKYGEMFRGGELPIFFRSVTVDGEKVALLSQDWLDESEIRRTWNASHSMLDDLATEIWIAWRRTRNAIKVARDGGDEQLLKNAEALELEYFNELYAIALHFSYTLLKKLYADKSQSVRNVDAMDAMDAINDWLLRRELDKWQRALSGIFTYDPFMKTKKEEAEIANALREGREPQINKRPKSFANWIRSKVPDAIKASRKKMQGPPSVVSLSGFGLAADESEDEDGAIREESLPDKAGSDRSDYEMAMRLMLRMFLKMIDWELPPNTSSLEEDKISARDWFLLRLGAKVGGSQSPMFGGIYVPEEVEAVITFAQMVKSSYFLNPEVVVRHLVGTDPWVGNMNPDGTLKTVVDEFLEGFVYRHYGKSTYRIIRKNVLRKLMLVVNRSGRFSYVVKGSKDLQGEE